MEVDWKSICEFSYEVEAQPLIDLLKSHSIPFEVKQVDTTFNPSFLTNPLLEKIVILVPHEYYQSASLLWEKAVSDGEWYDVYPYYIDDFTDEELEQILKNPQEWSSFDLNYAEKLWQKRQLGKQKT